MSNCSYSDGLKSEDAHLPSPENFVSAIRKEKLLASTIYNEKNRTRILREVLPCSDSTPCYIYDEEVLLANIDRIRSALRVQGLEETVHPHIPYFTNSNPHLFRIIFRERFGAVLQTWHELEHLKQFCLVKNSSLVASPSVQSTAEISKWVEAGIPVNLCSIEEVNDFTQNHPKSPLSFRLDVSETQKQRTGIKRDRIPELKQMLRSRRISPHGLHVYPGTGSSMPEMLRSLDAIFDVHKTHFPQAEELNLGGGFSFDYQETHPERKHFNWQTYCRRLAEKMESVRQNIQITIEPGRDVLADVGIQVMRVKRVVKGPHGLQIAATDSSFTLAPSAQIRQRNHRIEFYDKTMKRLPVSQKKRGKIAGCTTLSSDYIFPDEYAFPEELNDGDFICAFDMGAYAATQHLGFLNIPPPSEILVLRDGKTAEIVKKGNPTDKLRNTQELWLSDLRFVQELMAEQRASMFRSIDY